MFLQEYWISFVKNIIIQNSHIYIYIYIWIYTHFCYYFLFPIFPLLCKLVVSFYLLYIGHYQDIMCLFHAWMFLIEMILFIPTWYYLYYFIFLVFFIKIVCLILMIVRSSKICINYEIAFCIFLVKAVWLFELSFFRSSIASVGWGEKYIHDLWN